MGDGTGKQGRRRTAVLLAVIGLGSSLVVTTGSPTPASGQAGPPPSPLTAEGAAPPAPVRNDTGVELTDSTLREAVADLDASGDTGAEVGVDGDDVHVEVLHHVTDGEITRLIEAHGGQVTGSVPGVLAEGDVPFDELEALEAEDAVDVVRPPLPIDAPTGVPGDGNVTGEEVVKTNADAWQAIGQYGAGVKVGIIDGFDGSYATATRSRDVPPAAGTFCRFSSQNCNIFTGGTSHGVAVAEIIHDMAPSAQIYLGSAGSTADLQALVDYFDAQGVQIITRSLTSAYDGPGNGTGPIATVINNAVADGMAWFQSAGNNGGDPNPGGQLGSYYRGTWTDTNNNGFMEWAPGDEFLGFFCGFQNGLRWDDFGEGFAMSDYDLQIYTLNAMDQFVLQDVSTDVQGTVEANGVPIERATFCPAPTQAVPNPVVFARVGLFAPGTGGTSAGDVLEFSINGSGLEHWQNSRAASGPAADQNSNGALTVGAVDPANGVVAGIYSSQGPTNDNRIKPDISAAACVVSVASAPDCFNGTSAATPVAAGAAALVIGSGLATTPQTVRSWILANAITDRGVAGADNVYGAGEVILPAPPTAAAAVNRPDARIRTGTTGPIKGNNTYNGAGGAAQTVTQTGGANATRTYTMTFENDGNRAERFGLRGTRGNTKFVVTYKVNGVTVTNGIGPGSYQTPLVYPGGSVTVTVTVKIKDNTVRNNAFTGTVTATSATAATIKDAVKFTARRT